MLAEEEVQGGQAQPPTAQASPVPTPTPPPRAFGTCHPSSARWVSPLSPEDRSAALAELWGPVLALRVSPPP